MLQAFIIVLILLIIIYFIYRELFTLHPIVSTIDGMSYLVTGTEEANMMSRLNNFVIDLLKVMKRQYMNVDKLGTAEYKLTDNLLSRYDENVLEENVKPADKTLTSYVLNKGDSIKICLHDADTGKMHDENLLKFVILHELSHLAVDDYGHEQDFWKAFKFIITDAVRYLGYIPDNYANHNVNYCGISVKHNPFYDMSL
jgi:hypothetical protein